MTGRTLLPVGMCFALLPFHTEGACLEPLPPVVEIEMKMQAQLKELLNEAHFTDKAG